MKYINPISLTFLLTKVYKLFGIYKKKKKKNFHLLCFSQNNSYLCKKFVDDNE